MNKITGNPYLLFFPFLVLYAIIVIVGYTPALEGDEARYYLYAQNLLHGFYSPRDEVFLWNGPGYPIVLAIVQALHLPLIAGALLNAVFQYISVVFLYKALTQWTGTRTALFFTIIWAGYYVAYKELSSLLTEPLASMLMSLFLYCISRAFKPEGKQAKWIWWSGFLLGYLVLTKIMFGYVLTGLIVFAGMAYLLFRREPVRKSLLIVLVAMLVNLPYLFYTWTISNRLLYWGSSGGTVLYWASSPVKGEFGDWNDEHFTAYCGFDDVQPCNAELFARNHQRDYDSIYRFKGVERDDAFKQKAFQNIRLHPAKYLLNCVANTGRLFFNLPFSYNYHRMQNLWRIPAGALIFFLLIFSAAIMVVNRKHIPYILWFLFTLLLLYLGASVLVSAYQRLLTVAVPLILFCAAYLAQRTISFRFFR